MSNATTHVYFTVVDDELQVSVPQELAALGDFFESEIGTSNAMRGLIEHHIRHERTWQFTGNVCHLHLDGETVTIEHDYNGTCTTLTRADLRALLTDLRVLLTE
ncbi:uncharacterized protein YacL (UPF0231 family) [Kibdelosporangium banguiense]|uniref:Uncharacterized protein YacL (UPF0231 family) n=1 Tax=Kibdelosporangium banguiense TaxID=1365924 RepID=A0ABS4U1B1_9PSEU|nr:hypothetical protein [Kibdelosporangium banguiense]MBP2330426.1 uncharacterized protein YacL (UPF0231 family) [Kibdelosporangium banguiense]